MSQPSSVNFVHIGICVSDLQRSIRFYSEALGFTDTAAIGELGAPFDTLIELPGSTLQAHQMTCGGLKIELLAFPTAGVTGSSERKPMNQLGFTHMTLAVDDIDATIKRITEHGGKVHPETRVDSAYGPIVFCTDPDGVRIEIMQPAG